MTPLRYRLHLTPDAAAGTFAGDLTLDFEGLEDGREIVLDCLDLEVSDVWLDGEAVGWRQEGDRLIAGVAAPLAAPGRLRVVYTGRLSDTPRGLYGGEGFIASQFQPNHARRVFPCLDDPALRAEFELSVSAPDGQVALSNAALIGFDAGVARFAPTPPLPTHLMALAIGGFRTTVRDRIALHSLSSGPNDAWVLDMAVAALTFFETWLSAPFPFDKLDLVLLPQVGAAGMENSGAIFLRQAAVVRPTREAATLIAHEIAHQWFGGLVTPASWEELWLNEGFATWLAPKALPADLADVAAEAAAERAALIADSGPDARPLSGPAPEDPATLFDVLTYRKGAALLRMLEGWLGESAMRAGLAAYLASHAFGVAKSADLWAALETASGRPVAAVAGDFVGRTGPARVALTWQGETLRLTQLDEDLTSLPICLRIATDEGGERRTVLLEGPVLELTLAAPVRWAVAEGYFRALYPDGGPPAAELSAAEAVVWVEDAWLSLWAGESDLVAFLALAEEALAAGQAVAVLRPRLADLRDSFAAGPRQAIFDSWLADLLPPLPERTFDDLAGDLATDEEAAVTGLCALTDPAALEAQLGLIDRWPVLAIEGLLANPATRAAAWTCVKGRWDHLGEAVQGLGGRGLLAGLAAFADPAAAEDIAGFFRDRSAPTGLAGVLRRIAGRASFRQWAQPAMDAFLLRRGATGPAADIEPVLAAMVAGFHGALAQRALVDRLALPVPPWMHTADNLRGALAATERAWLQSLRGPSAVPVDLARRLVEDLEAAASQLDGMLSKLPEGRDPNAAVIVAGGLARDGATRGRQAELAVLAAALTKGEPAARPLRAVLADRRAEAAAMAAWTDAPPRTLTRFERLDLQSEAALAPGHLRRLGHDLRKALGETTPDPWAVFGLDGRTTALWQAAGFEDAEAAAGWRLRGFNPRTAADLAAQGADPAALRRRPLANPEPPVAVTLPDGTLFRVERVADPPLRAQGLMHRDSLPSRGGMLFVFPDERPRPITMRNVRFAIDAVWLGPDGEVRHIETAPAWRTDPVPVEPDRARCRYLLELPAGAARRHGLVVGGQVTLPV